MQVTDTTFNTVVLQAPPIACIDQNGRISEFRIKYAPSRDFQNDVNIRNGLFSPGVVIVGNLRSGTEYTFQLTILTLELKNVTLQPVVARTRGQQSR